MDAGSVETASMDAGSMDAGSMDSASFETSSRVPELGEWASVVVVGVTADRGSQLSSLAIGPEAATKTSVASPEVASAAGDSRNAECTGVASPEVASTDVDSSDATTARDACWGTREMAVALRASGLGPDERRGGVRGPAQRGVPGRA